MEVDRAIGFIVFMAVFLLLATLASWYYNQTWWLAVFWMARKRPKGKSRNKPYDGPDPKNPPYTGAHM